MTIKDAVTKRMLEIYAQKKKEILLKEEMSPSKIYGLLHERTKYSRVNTIHKFCEGADISLADFFASELFDDLDTED